MTGKSIGKQLEDQIIKKLEQTYFRTGVNSAKNSRKNVLHNKTSITSTTRGIANKKSNKPSKTDNASVIESLYKQNFRFYSESFSSSNPNLSNFYSSIKYIFDGDIRRFENAITANVKAYLDQQNAFRNTAATAKVKGFNKYGIDSRQMQMSLDTDSKKRS